MNLCKDRNIVIYISGSCPIADRSHRPFHVSDSDRPSWTVITNKVTNKPSYNRGDQKQCLAGCIRYVQTAGLCLTGLLDTTKKFVHTGCSLRDIVFGRLCL